MALFTLAAAGLLYDVLEGSLALALDGAPVATLELPEDAAPELGPADILIAQGDDEPVRFVGTLDFTRAFEGRVSVTWIGGAGTLAGEAIARHYTAAPTAVAVADVVAAILEAAGEHLEEGALDLLAGFTLPRWTRVAGETWAKALGRALEGTERRWRILDTGLVWIGVESWPEADAGGEVLDEGKIDRTAHVAFDRATLRPGTLLGGRQVVRVTFDASGHAVAELDDDASGARALARLVNRHLEPDPYARIWTAEVIAQHADQTIDLRVLKEDGAEHLELPFDDLTNVPFDSGVQGARYVLPQHARVRLAFRRAEPAGAFAFSLPADASAARGVARLNDLVDVGTLTVITTQAAPTALAIAWVPPAAAVLAGVAPVAITVSLGSDAQQQVPLTGALKTASEEVLLR